MNEMKNGDTIEHYSSELGDYVDAEVIFIDKRTGEYYVRFIGRYGKEIEERGIKN